MMLRHLIIILSTLAFLVSCGSQTSDIPGTSTTPSPQKFTISEREGGRVMEVILKDDDQTQIKSILAIADSMDGTKDQNVHKCAGCQLHMNGNVDHAIHIAGYELHHCSKDCRANFLKEPVTRILALHTQVEQ